MKKEKKLLREKAKKETEAVAMMLPVSSHELTYPAIINPNADNVGQSNPAAITTAGSAVTTIHSARVIPRAPAPPARWPPQRCDHHAVEQHTGMLASKPPHRRVQMLLLTRRRSRGWLAADQIPQSRRRLWPPAVRHRGSSSSLQVTLAPDQKITGTWAG